MPVVITVKTGAESFGIDNANTDRLQAHLTLESRLGITPPLQAHVSLEGACPGFFDPVPVRYSL